MKTRVRLLRVRLTEAEYQKLKNDADLCGRSMSWFIRNRINNYSPVSVPPLDYYELIREVRRVGYNMRQIAIKAHSIGLIDSPEYKRNADRLLNICDDLNMVCLPRKEEITDGSNRNLGGTQSSG